MSLLPSQTWGASPWSEPGTVQHTWSLIQERYADQPEVLRAFADWSQRTQIGEGGITVAEWLDGAAPRRPTRFSIEPADAAASKAKSTAAERAEENARLLLARPSRRAPPSEAGRVLGSDEHALAMRKALLLSDHAHDDGGLPHVDLSDNVRTRALGTYDAAAEGAAALINVRRGGPTPIRTTLHEWAHHHIATQLRALLGDEAVQRVAAAARATLTCERIAGSRALDRETIDYLLSPDELFARAYAQWVVATTGDAEGIAELRRLAANKRTFLYLWRDPEMKAISHEVVGVLRKARWL